MRKGRKGEEEGGEGGMKGEKREGIPWREIGMGMLVGCPFLARRFLLRTEIL